MRAFQLLVFLLSSCTLFSQEYKFRPLHIGFAYPISTNGLDAENCENIISIHGFMGVSAVEKAVCISGFYNNTIDYANGLQIAGFLNTVKNNFNGLQISGFMGSTGGFKGMQIAGFMNMGKEFTGLQMAGFTNNIESLKGLQIAGFMNNLVYDALGAQIAGFMNTTRDISGFQVAGFLNRSQDLFGMQIGGFLNKSSSTKGMQLGGFMNQSYDFDGFQIAGFMNHANDATGFQIAGFMNKTTDVKGMQIAGFLNNADNATGFQLSGFMNKARVVKGIQIAGFMNTADTSNFPIALINNIKNGDKKWSISSDVQGNAIVSYRSGGKYTYGIIGLGYNFLNKKMKYVTEAGFGLKTVLNDRFSINNELITLNLESFRDDGLNDNISLIWRITPTYSVSKKLEIFAGPTVNLFWTDNADGRNMVSKPINEIKKNDYYRQFYLSGIVGINYRIGN